MSQTTIIYTCGCTSTMDISDNLTRASIEMTDPSGSGRTHKLLIRRISRTPSVFIEIFMLRPAWAEACHVLVPFDIYAFEGSNPEQFAKYFAPWRERFGAVVPQCWLPEMLAGRGRFYGLWKWQRTLKSATSGHLRLVDGFRDYPGDEGTVGAEPSAHER